MTEHNVENIDLEKFSNRFSNESDRACAVLGAAYLDALLEGLYKKRFVHLSRKTTESLLNGTGPLGTFSSRISLAYALSWIDNATHQDLNTIRRIRNEFAHNFDHELDFNEESIGNRCLDLRSSKAFIDGFEECKTNNPNLSTGAVEAMRDVFLTPRWRFQIAVETIGQLIAQLPVSIGGTYTGLDLLHESYQMSANIRPRFAGGGTTNPP